MRPEHLHKSQVCNPNKEFTILIAIPSMLALPFRWLYRWLRYRSTRANRMTKRVVVLGLDGLDPSLLEEMIAAGELPVAYVQDGDQAASTPWEKYFYAKGYGLVAFQDMYGGFHSWISQKFTPELNVVALHGTGRHKLFDEIPRCDLVVTSYALIRRDWARYAALEFDTVSQAVLEQLAKQPPSAVGATKALFYRLDNISFLDGISAGIIVNADARATPASIARFSTSFG